MSTQTPDLRTAAQAVIDRWETPLWKDAPATAGYIAALRDALAADHTEHHLEMVGRWYMVNKDGMATLCNTQTDAALLAVDAELMWPHMGPHRAVQLVEAQATALAKPYCHEDCTAYTAGIEKELQDAQAAAHPALPEIKDMHNAPQHLNLNDRAMWVIGWNECRDAMRDSAMRTTQPAPMESVLVDGIAYQTPAPVAAELLRLHIDALQPAPAMPAAWMKRIDAAAEALSLIQASTNLGKLETMASLACEGLRGIQAAVAGCTRSHPHENMDSACRAKAAIAEMRNKAARGAEATAQDLERFVSMLAAAPTTQPAPQQEAQEPVAGQCRFPGAVWSECSPEHVRMVLANPEEWKRHEVRYLYTAPQPSPAAQGDALDTERLDWLALAGPVQICLVIDRDLDGEIEVAIDGATGYGRTLRAAIDAARAAQEGEQ